MIGKVQKVRPEIVLLVSFLGLGHQTQPTLGPQAEVFDDENRAENRAFPTTSREESMRQTAEIGVGTCPTGIMPRLSPFLCNQAPGGLLGHFWVLQVRVVCP